MEDHYVSCGGCLNICNDLLENFQQQSSVNLPSAFLGLCDLQKNAKNIALVVQTWLYFSTVLSISFLKNSEVFKK